MTQSIKLTMDQMRLMSLFQSVTRVTARDCVEDPKLERIIFVVNTGEMGKAIGRKGAHIRTLQNRIKGDVEIAEYHEDPEKFLRTLLNPKFVSEVRLNMRDDGSRQAVVAVDPQKKGLVVGREGRNAEKARILAKRYFGISRVMINSAEREQDDW